MIIDHIGIVVKSIKNSLKHWEKIFGYRQATEIVLNTRQKVRVVFVEKENSLPIKLIEPSDNTSPISTFAKRGGGLHHLCFKCEHLKNELEKLHGEGLRILAHPQPGEAFENEKIAFVYAGEGINIELVETDKRAKRVS